MYLSSLIIAPKRNVPPYNRALFRTWDIIFGNCDTREVVLKRDGTSVVTNSACAITSGHWTSPYDNIATDLVSDLDIDHVVPLKDAWLSGTSQWTSVQREAFANDLTRPALVAVTDSTVQAKGDRTPAEWMPPLASFHCTYVRAWVQVKHYYHLTVDLAEKNALAKYLADC